MSNWQPIETAPKDGTKVLTYVPSGHYKGVMINWWSDEHRVAGVWWESAATDPPTHWMPLPDPPAHQN